MTHPKLVGRRKRVQHMTLMIVRHLLRRHPKTEGEWAWCPICVRQRGR